MTNQSRTDRAARFAVAEIKHFETSPREIKVPRLPLVLPGMPIGEDDCDFVVGNSNAPASLQGSLKIEHRIIDGVSPGLRGITVRQSRDPFGHSRRNSASPRCQGKVKVRVTVPTQNGWKAIARSAGARQELFVSTAWSKDEVEAAFRRAGAE
jgi:hypothetical protein